MKKTFKLSHPKITYPRLIEATKSEVKKYLKRERNKALPSYADFWGFDCKFGQNEATSEVIHVAQINEKISFAESQEWTEFYLEILAVPAERTKRPIVESDEETEIDEDEFSEEDNRDDQLED